METYLHLLTEVLHIWCHKTSKSKMLDKTLLCPMPPCPGFYSSINFVLLGFVMQV